MSEPTRTGPVGSDPPPDDTVAADAAANGSEVPPSSPGYELRALIGRGGMGAVYRARDRELGREVAVKILLPHYAPNSATARRFVDEAGITGRLQHPGIPAIYRVGTLADGRPFLAMRLIDGRTLDELLGERTAPDEGAPARPGAARRDRVDAILQRGRLLAAFEQIAQAVGYAHQQGVIHRDLKPANVMVGAFGEVQVMDWGIARSATRRAVPASGEDPNGTADFVPGALHTPQADLTQAGSILGTPAFMPPEQAIGAVDQIDKRSDVFGLGAILCVVLTGEPPFLADTAETTRQLAARGKLDDCFARLDASGAEPELIALAKKCLAPEPADRPENADAVAKAVAGLRAAAEHRARQAETDRATADVKVSEERKRRRVWLALLLTLLALVSSAGFAAWKITDQRAAAARAEDESRAKYQAAQRDAERETTAALAEAQVLREQGWKQADDPERWALTVAAARSALRRANAVRHNTSGDSLLHRQFVDTWNALDQDERDRALLAELNRIGEENDIRFLFPLALSQRPAERYAAAFRAAGFDLAAESHDRAAAWLKGHRFRAQLTAAVRSWRYSIPTTDLRFLFGEEPSDPLIAVGGGPAAVARTDLPARLARLADAVTDDPFAREWWATVARRDAEALAGLLVRPEMERVPSEELSVFAEGLQHRDFGTDEGAGFGAVLAELLRAAYKRFPGAYWVNFRLAYHHPDAQLPPGDGKARPGMVRHLSAAVAARPRSAAARTALAVALLEGDEHDPTAIALLSDAADLDPRSVWAPLLLADVSLQVGEPEAAEEAVARAVRADPDTGFFLVNTLLFKTAVSSTGKRRTPNHAFTRGALDRLVREHPEHPGGYDLRADFRMRDYDYSGAMADLRAVTARPRPGYLRTPTVLQLPRLERLARWKEELPAALRGEQKLNANELRELAEYCAGFEQRFALAARFAGDALTAAPFLLSDLFAVPQAAGWAVRASTGAGADGAALSADERTRLRQRALAWLQQSRDTPNVNAAVFAAQVWENQDLAPVRAGQQLRALSSAEQDEWHAFWASVPNPFAPTELAPAPREVKR